MHCSYFGIFFWKNFKRDNDDCSCQFFMFSVEYFTFNASCLCSFASFYNSVHNFTWKVADQVAWVCKDGMPMLLGGASLCMCSVVNFFVLVIIVYYYYFYLPKQVNGECFYFSLRMRITFSAYTNPLHLWKSTAAMYVPLRASRRK